jgi:hypothetical protein
MMQVGPELLIFGLDFPYNLEQNISLALRTLEEWGAGRIEARADPRWKPAPRIVRLTFSRVACDARVLPVRAPSAKLPGSGTGADSGHR